MSNQDTFHFESENGSFSWKHESFDTEILERKTAQILSFSPYDTKESITQLGQNLLESFVNKEIQYATYRLSASNFPVIHTLEDKGFRIVDGQIRLESKDLGNYAQENENIVVAEESDLVGLQKLAAISFSQTRYYNDSLISKHQADRIYAEWIKNSLVGDIADLVLVWKEANALFGFVTLDKKGRIPLIAVDEKQRGKGIGKSLIKASLAQFQKWELTGSTIDTQLTNVQAIRTYLGCGYKISASYLTLRWSNK